MKVYKVTLLVVDHDELGAESIKIEVENVRYPNHCISPTVMECEGVDIGEWDDDHPLNNNNTMAEEFGRLFTEREEDEQPSQ